MLVKGMTVMGGGNGRTICGEGDGELFLVRQHVLVVAVERGR